MTNEERKVFELALEALQDYVDEHGPWSDDSGAQYVLRVGKEALAQPEQEPVANVVLRDGLPTLLANNQIKPTDERLYTTPPQPEKPDQDEVDIRSRLYQRIHELETQLAQPEQAPVAFDVQKALRRAYHLGQNYWADADSESYAANKRSDKHRQNFDELCEEAFAYTTPPQRKPLTSAVNDEMLAALEWITTYIENAPQQLTEAHQWAKISRGIIEAAHGIKE